mgnify:CR=1 FL=1
MITIKINKQLTLFEGFNPKVYQGLYIETVFNYEELTFNSVIKEWNGTEVVNPTIEIPQLQVMKNLVIDFNQTPTTFTNVNNDIRDTIKQWIIDTIKVYILSRTNPFTQQPYFTNSDLIIE